MEIAFVQERDFGVGALQRLRGNQSAKAAAKYQNLVFFGHKLLLLPAL
jgi:hypothetical protein